MAAFEESSNNTVDAAGAVSPTVAAAAVLTTINNNDLCAQLNAYQHYVSNAETPTRDTLLAVAPSSSSSPRSGTSDTLLEKNLIEVNFNNLMNMTDDINLSCANSSQLEKAAIEAAAATLFNPLTPYNNEVDDDDEDEDEDEDDDNNNNKCNNKLFNKGNDDIKTTTDILTSTLITAAETAATATTKSVAAATAPASLSHQHKTYGKGKNLSFTNRKTYGKGKNLKIINSKMVIASASSSGSDYEESCSDMEVDSDREENSSKNRTRCELNNDINDVNEKSNNGGGGGGGGGNNGKSITLTTVPLSPDQVHSSPPSPCVPPLNLKMHNCNKIKDSDDYNNGSCSSTRKRKLININGGDDDSNDCGTETTAAAITSIANGISDENETKINFVRKARGRYKKNRIESEIAIDPNNIGKPQQEMDSNDKSVFSLLNNISIVSREEQQSATASTSATILETEKNALVVDTTMTRQFVNHVTGKKYYMYVVCESKNPNERCHVFYANCVGSVTLSYSNYFCGVDRYVMVVSFDRFRFMISYKLLKKLNVAIPLSEDFSLQQLQNQNQQPNVCYFNDVKDFEFVSLLVDLFQLDTIYARAKTVLMLAAMGQTKSDAVINFLTDLNKKKTMYSMPFEINGKCKSILTADSESAAAVLLNNGDDDNDNNDYNYHHHKTHGNGSKIAALNDASLFYVDKIVNVTQNARFKTITNAVPINETTVLESLKFWLRDKVNKSAQLKSKDCFFTYKYGSVVRLLYDVSDACVNKLVKIKKDTVVTTAQIEYYLNSACANENNDNFILLSNKLDERLTIIKRGVEFIWITSVIKNILPNDIIRSFKKFNHHVFNLNKSNRKEINNRHNGMIKLLAYYTGDVLKFDQIVKIAQNNFGCVYFNKNYID
nr:hypothetical protein Caab_133 [Calliteara abietis nucleopolyhedrovirus]